MRKKRIKNPEWSLEDTIQYLKDMMSHRKVRSGIKRSTERTELERTRMYEKEYSSKESSIKRITVCSTTKGGKIGPNWLSQKSEKEWLPCVFCENKNIIDKCAVCTAVNERLEKLKLGVLWSMFEEWPLATNLYEKNKMLSLWIRPQQCFMQEFKNNESLDSNSYFLRMSLKIERETEKIRNWNFIFWS